MNQSIKHNMLRNGLILTLFAVITTGLIALTYFGTKDQIAKQQQLKLLSILNAVIDPQSHDNDIHLDCALFTSRDLLGNKQPQHIYRARINGEAVAVAIETTAPDGYNGRIQLVVGMLSTNPDTVTVSGVRILTHKETPGLGDKIELRISDWVLAFEQQQYSPTNKALWAVKKDGGQYDQFTGATITPRAVVNAVTKSMEFYLANQEDVFTADNACGSTQQGSNKDE